MIDMAFTYNEFVGRFFWFDWAFWGNVSDDVRNVFDLITFNDKGYPTYMATVLNDLMSRGAKFIVCRGAIDEYGNKCKRALYCINYDELYCTKNRVKSK